MKDIIFSCKTPTKKQRLAEQNEINRQKAWQLYNVLMLLKSRYRTVPVITFLNLNIIEIENNRK